MVGRGREEGGLSAAAERVRPRLYLLAHDGEGAPPEGLAAAIEAALGAGDVAAVLLPRPERVGEAAFAPLVAAVQAAGAAALVEAEGLEDVALARRLGLDGLHVEGDAALAARCLSERGDLIVGAGGVRSRHEAMVAAEAGADYLSFGRIALADGFDAPHPRTLEEAAWWAETFETPAVVHGGGTLAALADAIATGAEFIAYGRAVLSHPEGPALAVRTIEAACEAAASGER